MSAAVKITEAHVQQSVVQFLELDGWRVIRTHPLPPIVQRLDGIMHNAPVALRSAWALIRRWVLSHADAESFGEPGMPDYLFLRYWRPDNLHNDTRPIGEMIWIEFKRYGQKLKPHQQAWYEAETKRGALVMLVDDIDEFTRWYKTSGLCRRIL